MYQVLFLAYMPKLKAFVVSDTKVNKVIAKGNIPVFKIQPDDAKVLGLKVTDRTPTIGFLLGREKGYYSIDFNYAKAISMAGGAIQGLSYTLIEEQMKSIDGLVLPGGSFVSPDEFYANRVDNPEEPTARSEASVEHKTSEVNAHQVITYPATPLRELLGKKITVNSRHREGLVPNDWNSDLEIYAVSSDCIPEAWGNMEEGILCVQWHPEDFVVNGDRKMLDIYKWLVCKSRNRMEFSD